MTSILYFAVDKQIAPMEKLIWETPLSQIILLLRQERCAMDDKVLTLQQQDIIDKADDWQKAVQENRKQIMEAMKNG